MTDEQLIDKLTQEKQVAWDFQSRRHTQWNENYELYRDFVKTNRLTQRQAINFPIMKTSLRTLLANVDDPPSLEFKCLEGGETAQKKDLVINEMWNDNFEKLNFEDIDILDKKNVFLYGRSHKKLNFLNKEFKTEVLDNWDILVDPKTNPMDIETAKFLVHVHIFRPLRNILADEKYTQEGKNKLKSLLDTQTEGGLIKMASNQESLAAKQERLETMGVENFDEFGASDVIVELNEHYTQIWEGKKFVRYIVVLAMGGESSAILFKKPLKEVIGIEEWPVVTWADDLELSDYWSDGKADTVRTPNRILNIWLSQLLENRTLRNYGMHWFDSTKNDYTPTQYEPKPFGMYPCPGNPSELTKQVDIPDLSESLDEMMFIKGIIEEATSATPTKKGIEGKQKTLGEVDLMQGESNENITSIAKFYRKSWYQYANKWYAILDANVSISETLELYKESTKGSGKVFKKIVKAEDWKSKKGYKVKVLSTSEQQQKNTTEINKWIAVKNQFVDNPKLVAMAERKILEALKIPKSEIDEIVEVSDNSLMPGGLSLLPPKINANFR